MWGRCGGEPNNQCSGNRDGLLAGTSGYQELAPYPSAG
jgi:hypothetical protein